MPAIGFEPGVVSDFLRVPAETDASEACEQVGDLDGGDEMLMFGSLEWGVVIPGRANEDGRELMLLQVAGAEFGMIDAEQFAFGLQQLAGTCAPCIDGVEVIGERSCHGDLADVMEQPRDIVHFGGRAL